MANIASARKRARQDVKRNAHNTALRSRYRTAIKAVRKAIEAGDKVKAKRNCLLHKALLPKLRTRTSSTRIQQPATSAVYPLP
jgi:ribosomal protein S20